MVLGAGVNHRCVKLFVPQQLLDAGYRAAGVEQLRSGGVSQAMGGDIHPHPLPGGFQPPVDQVLAQGLNAQNSSSLASGKRPPVLGYLPFWNQYVSPLIDSITGSGPMSKVTQDFWWTEDVSYR